MEKRPEGRGLLFLVLAFRYAYGLHYSSLWKIRPLAADK